MSSIVKTSVDSFTDKARTSANLGQAAYISLNGDATNTRYGYLFFARPFPLGATIFSATLNLYLGEAWTGSQTITAKRITDPWTELGITWDNQPAVTASNSGSVVVSSGAYKDLASIDLTAMMGVVSALAPWYGIRLEVTGSNNRAIFAAENPQQTYRASLEVDWSVLPKGPINLMPRGSLATSLARPVLDWQFASKDHTAQRQQAQSQVQVHTTTDFTSPEYNSGMVANTESNWDLSAQTYSFSLGTVTVTIASPAVFTFTSHGLIVGDQVRFTTTGALPTGLTVGTIYYVTAIPTANTFRVSTTLGGSDVNTSGSQSGTHTLFRYGVPSDGTRYWRVRVQDDTGQNSDWSDTVAFQRKTQGTLTITNPPVSPSNQVNEITPPITWSLSGRTQEAVELSLYQYDGTRKQRKWHLPKRVTTALSYELPTNLLKSTESFQVVVRTWDTIDRAVTQGDPDYVQLARDFTYVRAGGITAVTNLTAIPIGAAVNLTWQRASAPVLFSLRVDGVEVMNDIDPTETFTSGTSYAMNYYAATPRVSHTYEIEAIAVSGGKLVHSDTNDTDTATTVPIGHYLIDPEDGTSCNIKGLDSPDMAIRVNGTTYDIAGSRVPVRITDSVGGYSGSLSGHLEGKTDRDDLLDLYGRLKPLRLVVGDSNFEVQLEEVSAPPNTDRLIDEAYNVVISWFQTDDFTFAIAGGD